MVSRIAAIRACACLMVFSVRRDILLDFPLPVANTSNSMTGTQVLESRLVLNTERLGPLPLVNHFIQRLGLEELLDRYVPTDARGAVSHARALGVLLRSIIVEREPIYRQNETVHEFAPGLFGVPAAEFPSLGDDRIGRALDKLFDADRGALLTEVVVQAAKRFDIRFDRLHNDTTSI